MDEIKKNLFILFFGMRFANAQTYAFIDSDYILKNVPEYVEAKERLDKMAERWTKEIEERYEVIKTKKASFDREEVLLPKEEREKRKTEIEKLEKDGHIGKDDLARGEKELEKITGDHVAKIDELLKHKESELLEV